MERTRPRAPLGTLLGCLLMVFLVLFPKGGSRLGGVPLTWGYLLLMLSAPVVLAVRIVSIPLVFPRRVLVLTFLLVPMQLLFLYAGHFYGISNPPFAFSTFVGLFALPWIFLLVYAPFFPMLDGVRLARWFRNCVFLAAAWGIFLFFFFAKTRHLIEVPYITTSAGDVVDLANAKDNARGLLLKLMSTYNNGNLYGVATLLLLPLYLRLEPSRMRRLVVRLALLLTLSRTVWAGLVLNELLSVALNLLGQVKTFPVLFLGAARRRLLAVAATAGFAVVAVLFSGLNMRVSQFLFDPTAAGRSGQVVAAEITATMLPTQPLYGFAEVLYASAAQYWGWLGLVAFTLIMISPVLFLLWDPAVLRSPLRRAALKALMIYIVVAASDGALDFIPVMAFYWFVYAVFLYGWPGQPTKGVSAREALPKRAGPLLESPAGA